MHKENHHSGIAVSLILAIMLFLLVIPKGHAQSGNLNWVQPIEGIEVHPIFHASLELKTSGKSLLVDPSFDPSLVASLQNPDIILLTDIHGDHLDLKLLNKIEEKFGTKPIICPKAVAEMLPERLLSQVKVLDNGDTYEWEGFLIEAVPMYNLGDGADVFHPKGRGNGYVLIVGAKRIYISGDTEATAEFRQLKNIDLAFVCMNLPYTMDVNQAAAGVLDFQPAVVIPYHYRGASGFADIESFKKQVEGGGKNIKVELLNFYP